MKIIIFGASASGTSTLAAALGARLGIGVIDADGFYWKQGGRPFEFRNDPAERNRLLYEALDSARDVVVAGSVFTWDEALFGAFDFAVFCYVPKAERMRRLLEREAERYGHWLQSDAWYRQKSADFVEWASQYDEPGFPSRSLELHEGWIARLGQRSVPVLRLEGSEGLEVRVEQVLYAIGRWQQG